MDRENVIEGLRDIDMFIAGRLGHEKAKNFLRTIDETIDLLKEQKGLMLALEQSNSVNEYLNTEVERLKGLLKEQEARIEQLNRFVNGFSREAVPVVRCKDCKAWKQYDDLNLGECELFPEYNKIGDWFCNFGERK